MLGGFGVGLLPNPPYLGGGGKKKKRHRGLDPRGVTTGKYQRGGRPKHRGRKKEKEANDHLEQGVLEGRIWGVSGLKGG